jgi:ligand-binding SRPBCC domain-containing protein
MSRTYTYRCEQWLDRPRDEVFAFFSDATNLQQITPPWLDFQVVSETPIDMRVGAMIDYRLKVRLLPMRWRSEITLWDPPHRFIDEQRRGPYRMWHHEHRFEPQNGGTLVIDAVNYQVPGGSLFGPVIHRLMVQPDVERIFAYRRQRLEELLGHPSSAAA